MIMCNVGSKDRTLRIIIGLVLFVTLFAMKTWFWLLALIPLTTGILEFCPINALLGINTCKVPKKWWQ